MYISYIIYSYNMHRNEDLKELPIYLLYIYSTEFLSSFEAKGVQHSKGHFIVWHKKNPWYLLLYLLKICYVQAIWNCVMSCSNGGSLKGSIWNMNLYSQAKNNNKLIGVCTLLGTMHKMDAIGSNMLKARDVNACI